MIDERLARDAIGLLSTAAAMLIEEAHDALVMRPTAAASAAALASHLESVGDDLSALGAAASALARVEP